MHINSFRVRVTSIFTPEDCRICVRGTLYFRFGPLWTENSAHIHIEHINKHIRTQQHADVASSPADNVQRRYADMFDCTESNMQSPLHMCDHAVLLDGSHDPHSDRGNYVINVGLSLAPTRRIYVRRRAPPFFALRRRNVPEKKRSALHHRSVMSSSCWERGTETQREGGRAKRI